MSNDREIVYWAENEAEAVVVIAQLEQYQIPAFKLQEGFGAMNSLSFGIFGQIAIAVPKDRVSEAEAVILTMDEDENEREFEEAETMEESDDEEESEESAS